MPSEDSVGRAYREEITTWRRLGHCYELSRLGLKHGISPLKLIQMYLAMELVRELARSLEEVTEEFVERQRSKPSHPYVPSPSEQAVQHWPTMEPTPQVRTEWPPFTGLRIELGGDGA